MRQFRTPPPHDSWADAVLEAGPYQGATFEAHYEAFVEACRLAFKILDNRPDREQVLAYREPLPGHALATLQRLRTLRKP